jgi:hypothetical protein
MAVVAAAAALTAGCGLMHVSVGGGGSSPTPGNYQHEIAYAHCMQTHGVPNFPDPNPSGQFHQVQNPNGGNSPLTRANNECKSLLSQGTPASTPVSQQQIDLVLKIVQCLRRHGEPNTPDPTVKGSTIRIALPQSVVNSSQFQAAVNACRSLIPKGVRI